MITTARFILRPFERGDYEAYAAMLAEPDVRWRPVVSAEDAWHRLVRHVGHWALFGYGNFAILEQGSNAFLGETGLWAAYRGMGARYDGFDEAGWSVLSRWHGRGVAFEAAEAVHAWHAKAVGRRRTVCMTDPANARSIRLALKLGYAPFETGVYKGEAVIMFERPANA